MTGAPAAAPQKKQNPPTSEDIAVVHFEHKLFRTFKSLYFRRASQADGEPVMVIDMSGSEAALPFPGIRREFDIAEDSADGRMLETVAEALYFVRELRVGDPVPREIVTGEASWEISDQHRQIAYQRLTLQLAGWLSGDEVLITDVDELLQVAEDPGTKKRVNAAFGEAAEQLGLGRERVSEVVDLIESLADDLAGIEALRDKFKVVLMMHYKIQRLRMAYGQELSVMEIADPVARLMAIAAAQFRDQFELIDAQTGEIIAVLKNIDAQRAYIRRMRDDLHARLLDWNEMFEAWKQAKPCRFDGAPDLLRETYRFLAPRYMKVNEWALNGQGQDKKKEPRRREMVW